MTATPLRALLWSYGLAALALAAPVVAKLAWDIPPEDMLRDGVSVMEAPAYVGVISNLGLILWGATAGICGLAAAPPRAARGYWLCAAGLTLMLLADDWLLLHENAFPNHVGVPENLVYGTYALAVLAYILRCRARLLEGDWPVLVLAFGWFAASLVVDRLDGVIALPALYLWEDGAKLLGIVSWLLFHARLASAGLSPRDRSPAA